MNRYPLWINLLIGFALLIGVVYTLPNFFGEVPAIQVSPAKSTQKVDTDLQQRVEAALKAASITNDGIFLEPASLKVRFADTDTQLKAKDAVQKVLGEDFVVALNLVSRSPRFLTAIGALPMYLGLDLRGGVHFLLQVDMASALTKKLDGVGSNIRGLLRDKRISYGSIGREGQNLLIKFRDADTRSKARKEIETANPELGLSEQEQGGEFRLVATLKPEEEKRTQDLALQQNIATLRNRVNELGVAEPIIQQQGADRIVVQLPGVQDTARAKELLGRTASLELRLVEAHASDPSGRDYDPQKIDDALKGNVPFGTELFIEKRGKTTEPLLLSKNVIITGERLTNAAPSFDQQNNEPIVSVELDGQGARIMRDVTREAVKRRMAVLLIEKGKPEVITAPVIQSELGARFQISGRMSTREANDLALLLRAGSLAAPMDIIEERTVGPSLGADNIKIGFHSTWIGFTAIAIFMIVVLPDVRRHFGRGARFQRAVPGLSAVDAAGDPDAARHGRHRADGRHGDRRQRADQRADPRGVAQRQHAAGGDPCRLRARMGHHSRFQHHDADRRLALFALRLGPGQRFCGRAVPGHSDLDIQRGDGIAQHRQSVSTAAAGAWRAFPSARCGKRAPKNARDLRPRRQPTVANRGQEQTWNFSE